MVFYKNSMVNLVFLYFIVYTFVMHSSYALKKEFMI